MATLNIRRDVTDPFYRYKMEKLQSKIEGKGNGIKSVVVNLSSVAASLSRPPIYVVKFFGFELGAQTNNGDHDRWIINGAHEAAKLQDYLDNFIKKFVLCQECLNPETDLSVSKDGNIIRNCKACGQRTLVDPRHKLSSYILKNPPKKERKVKTDKADKKRKGEKGDDTKEASNSEEDGQNGNGNGNGHVASNTSNLDQYAEAGSDDEFTRRIQADASALPAVDSTNDKEDWSVDVSEEAVKARAKDLPSDLKKALVLNGDDDDEDAEGESNKYDQFGEWVSAQHDPSDLDDIEVFKKAQELGIEKKSKTLTILAQVIFDDSILKAKQISSRAPLLKKLVTSERHQRALLGGIERLVGKVHPALISGLPTILHQLYDSDIVTEEAVLKWGNKASKKYVDLPTNKKVRKAAEPFLKWLEEAEEDSDEEEESEEDDE